MTKIPFKKLPIVLASSLVLSATAYANENTKQSPMITIYQGNIALIAESRDFQLDAQNSQLFLPNVSPETLTESLMISFTPVDTKNPTPKVIEKKLNRNLLSPSAMLDYSVGKTVNVITNNNGKEKVETATILSNNGGLLLQYKDHIELGLPDNARLSFTSVPEGLNTTPVLSVILKSLPEETSDYRADLNYLTRGISWNADYIAKLDDATKSLKLEGWANIQNSSGMDYKAFKINLVAGDLNIVDSPQFAPKQMNLMRASIAPEMDGGAMPEAMGDYHLYSIPETSTLSNNEQTQISLFTVDSIPYTTTYTFDNYSETQRLTNNDRPQNASVSIKFKNDKDANLGFALPEGVIRVYQDENTGTMFMGSDRVPATPNNESVTINTGKAFDITMKRTQSKFAVVNADEWEVSYTLTLQNEKAEAVSTQVKESFYPGSKTNWEIISQSEKSTINNDVAIWNIEVPANSRQELSYTVRYTIFKDDKQVVLPPQ